MYYIMIDVQIITKLFKLMTLHLTEGCLTKHIQKNYMECASFLTIKKNT